MRHYGRCKLDILFHNVFHHWHSRSNLDFFLNPKRHNQNLVTRSMPPSLPPAHPFVPMSILALPSLPRWRHHNTCSQCCLSDCWPANVWTGIMDLCISLRVDRWCDATMPDSTPWRLTALQLDLPLQPDIVLFVGMSLPLHPCSESVTRSDSSPCCIH